MTVLGTGHVGRRPPHRFALHRPSADGDLGPVITYGLELPDGTAICAASHADRGSMVMLTSSADSAALLNLSELVWLDYDDPTPSRPGQLFGQETREARGGRDMNNR